MESVAKLQMSYRVMYYRVFSPIEIQSNIQTFQEAKEQCKAEFRKREEIVDKGESQSVEEFEDASFYSSPFFINVVTFTAEAGEIREQYYVEEVGCDRF